MFSYKIFQFLNKDKKSKNNIISWVQLSNSSSKFDI